MSAGFTEGFPTGTRAQRPILYVLTPKPDKPLDCIILGPRVISHEMHFDRSIPPRGRGVPCVGLPACPYCKAYMRAEPKVFLPACHNPSLLPFVLQLSDGGTEDYKGIIAKLADPRGLCLLVSRADNRQVARMRAISKGRWEGRNLPATFDVQPELERIWGMRTGIETATIVRMPRPEQARQQKGR